MAAGGGREIGTIHTPTTNDAPVTQLSPAAHNSQQGKPIKLTSIMARNWKSDQLTFRAAAGFLT